MEWNVHIYRHRSVDVHYWQKSKRSSHGYGHGLNRQWPMANAKMTDEGNCQGIERGSMMNGDRQSGCLYVYGRDERTWDGSRSLALSLAILYRLIGIVFFVRSPGCLSGGIKRTLSFLKVPVLFFSFFSHPCSSSLMHWLMNSPLFFLFFPVPIHFIRTRLFFLFCFFFRLFNVLLSFFEFLNYPIPLNPSSPPPS